MSARSELVLALDTSGPHAGLVLAGSDRVDTALLPRRDNGQARTEDLSAHAAALLDARGCTAADLSAVGAVVGPGSYTGLRSGLAFLRGLAFVDALPGVAVGSLELLAWRGCGTSETVSVALSLGPGRVVAAAYARSGEDLCRTAEPRIVEDGEIEDFFVGPGAGCTALVTLVAPAAGGRGDGEGHAGLETAARRAGLDVRRESGDGLRQLASLVVAKARRADTVRVAALLPVYVGVSTARPNRHRVALHGTAK